MAGKGLTGRFYVALVLLAALALGVTACALSSARSAPGSRGGAKDSLPVADQVGIYRAIVGRLYATDDTFGGKYPKPVVHLVGVTDDSAGDPTVPSSDPVALSDAVKQGLTDELGDLATEVRWVDSVEDALAAEGTGAVLDAGVVITLGNIRRTASDTVEVAASIYIDRLASGGRTYVVKRIDGVWVVTGTTGAEWIS